MFVVFVLGACAETNTFQTNGDGGPVIKNEAGQSFGQCKPGSDSDNDGIPDEVEGCNPAVDTDNDGIPDYADNDSDNDGVPDGIEGTADSDGDGIPDYKDEDSDNDGVKDGDEDLNGDGKLGCCLTTCGEQRAGCGKIDPNQCGPGQTCNGGQCTPSADFLCSNGESNPKSKQTYPTLGPDQNLPFFVCRKKKEDGTQGLKAIDFPKSGDGNWKIALEANTPYADLTVTGAAAQEAAAAFDYGQADQVVAGFVLSKPNAAAADVNAATSALVVAARSIAGVATANLLSTGSPITSHDKFPTVVSTRIALTLSAAKTAGAVRNALYKALLGKDVAKGGFDNYGPSVTEHRLRLQTQIRPDGRLIVLGGVAPTTMVNDATKKTQYILDDVSNGTGLATTSDGDTIECDPFIFKSNPIADIIWVVDDSGSMSGDRDNIIKNAKDFFARAIKSGLDFRMAITGVADPSSFNPFNPPITVGKLCSVASTDPFNDGGPDRFLNANEQSTFEACIGNPPYNEGSSEYGLAHAYEAVERALPRTAGAADKIRPEATLAIIFATDEVSKELKGGDYSPPGWTKQPAPTATGTCPLPAATQTQLDQFITPWVKFFTGGHPKWGAQGKAVVNLIGGLCSSSCAEVGHGYLELVKATGGISADICQTDLGATLQVIIDNITGAASPLVLQYTPISASLAVAVGGQQHVRSRVKGFDYVGSSNSLVLIGVAAQKGVEVVASYRRWVKQATID
ncbi:MAG: hypothetical protein KC503_31775 [Myxococcales bacterium]|nr:hypothetical protein [Myxococcales bacterium]